MTQHWKKLHRWTMTCPLGQKAETWEVAANTLFQFRNQLRQGEKRGRRELFVISDGRKYPLPCPIFGIIKTARMEHERADGAEKDGSK